MRILVTGAAGFIGYHLCRTLLDQGHEVVGLDNLNAYYDVNLKYARLRELGIEQEDLVEGRALAGKKGFTFYYQDLTDAANLLGLFADRRPEVVVQLAAQAGVRHSIHHPQSFIDSNLTGFFNVLEACRRFPVRHLLYASSSSVYGANAKIPFSETDRTDQPLSLYGATKKAGEVLAHSYAELYGIPMTGLRFFTVYGPWGRPDMAYYKFAAHIVDGRSIDIYNNGDMSRDFTYVDDIIQGITALIDLPPQGVKGQLHRILNIGRSQPVNLMEFVELLEKHLGREARKHYLSMQPGDVPTTWADTGALSALTGYAPSTDLETGIRTFVGWFTRYHGLDPMPTTP